MKKLIQVSGIMIGLSAILMLSACASVNVPKYTPGVVTSSELSDSLKEKVSLGEFTYSQDSTSIDCRGGANIELPNQMRYTQYIRRAFEAELITAHRYTATNNAHKLSVNFKKIDFSSIDGKWVISGYAQVDAHSPVFINMVSNFGTSYDWQSACQNVANGLGPAVQSFITQTLTNQKIANYIR